MRVKNAVMARSLADDAKLLEDRDVARLLMEKANWIREVAPRRYFVADLSLTPVNAYQDDAGVWHTLEVTRSRTITGKFEFSPESAYSWDAVHEPHIDMRIEWKEKAWGRRTRKPTTTIQITLNNETGEPVFFPGTGQGTSVLWKQFEESRAITKVTYRTLTSG
ncbi:hypothetical protein [Streptomyces sp. NPDC090112]|uniref:hypothetical protein n=1 Tax=Streptomyces sp. NPDC090112 TaxID=3365949 RepID=UPI0037F48594